MRGPREGSGGWTGLLGGQDPEGTRRGLGQGGVAEAPPMVRGAGVSCCFTSAGNRLNRVCTSHTFNSLLKQGLRRHWRRVPAETPGHQSVPGSGGSRSPTAVGSAPLRCWATQAT